MNEAACGGGQNCMGRSRFEQRERERESWR
jgi:hypothetical protein